MLTIAYRLLVKIQYYSCWVVEKQNASLSCVDGMVKRRQLVVILSLTIRTVGGALSVFNTHRAFVRRIQIVAIGINNSEIYYKHVTNRMKATTPCALLNNEKWKAQNIFMAFWFNAYMQREEPFFTCRPFKSTKYVLWSCYLYTIFIFT